MFLGLLLTMSSYCQEKICVLYLGRNLLEHKPCHSDISVTRSYRSSAKQVTLPEKFGTILQDIPLIAKIF